MKTIPQSNAGAIVIEKESMLSDFIVLTKARLTALVLATTFVGFCLASAEGVNWLLLLNTLLGTALVAGGASVFNQLMERAPDRLMNRTKDRPLAVGRIEKVPALILAIGLSLAGLVYLLTLVNTAATVLAGLTLFVYVAIYTPCKQISSISTLLGAVSGALPPVIGWFAAGGRTGPEAWFLFWLLFFWQLPHFVAINWLYREEYERAGFVMWSNGDLSGKKSASLALVFSLGLLGITLWPAFTGMMGMVYLVGAAILGLITAILSFRFLCRRQKRDARILFFYTLFYLPLILGLLLAGKK